MVMEWTPLATTAVSHSPLNISSIGFLELFHFELVPRGALDSYSILISAIEVRVPAESQLKIVEGTT